MDFSFAWDSLDTLALDLEVFSFDYLIDSFSAGIVLYILCSGGMHPFYNRGFSQKEYIDKLISQKCLCKFSTEMPLLARNLFLKLCSEEEKRL